MKPKHWLYALYAAAVFVLAGCDERGDETLPVAALPEDSPDAFLQYLNTQPALAAGDYEVVVATTWPNSYGQYRLSVTMADGDTREFAGGWAGSGGRNAHDMRNPRHTISLSRAGGLTVALEASTSGYLYLVRNGQVIAQDGSSGPGGTPLIDLPVSAISSAAYGAAYYAAVDPDGERATVEDFKRRNCFVAGHPDCAVETVGYQAHVVFRDSKDLGYGRNMYARRNSRGTVDTADDSFAFFVDNYVVRLQPGSSTNYGPMNVEPAVREDRDYHRGTNAIEFTPIDPDDPASERITRFFTYSPAGERITSADLDGRGVKHMPGMCFACHGGRLLPLEPDGSFPLQALRSAKYNLLELDTFDYSAEAGFSRAEQEADFRLMNRFVYESWQQTGARDDSEPGKWHADFALEIAAGHYGGAAFPAATYQDDFVPAGWQAAPGRPEGIEQLYLRVVAPHCVACHSQQGTRAGQIASTYGNAINFSSWEKFISYREVIIDYVYRRGVMPLALRNYEAFWRDPQDKPALLASFLSEPALFDAAGRVLVPGLPVARPGADRVAPSPVRLDGTASGFAQVYDWDIVHAPLGATVSLDDDRSARPLLTADMDGDYLLSLRVANSQGVSAAVEMTVTIDSGMADPATLTFENDIQPLLENPLSADACTLCHVASSPYPGIPVSYDPADNPRVYRDVLARINLAEPENSALLVKPTGLRHGGGIQMDLSSVEGRDAYNTILAWIRAGAPCSDQRPLPASCQ